MQDLNVNLAIWGMFMNATLRAAVHLGKDFNTNLPQLFDETKRLISDQSEILGPKKPEILGLKTIDFVETTWRSTSYCAKELIRSRMLQ